MIRSKPRFLLWSLLAASIAPASAQVPAVAEAYVWRGLDLEWGQWTHRLGALGSYIAWSDDGGSAVQVRGHAEGGVFVDPGGASVTTHYTHVAARDAEDEVRFWHLRGDEIVLRGGYDCTAWDGAELGVYRTAMTLGAGAVAGFDPGRIDVDGVTPAEFDHSLALLNGFAIDPRTPNDAHTVDYIHVAVDGDPVYDAGSGMIDVPMHVEYSPGCVPAVGHACANGVEGPHGAEEWVASIRPYLLIVAWNDGAAEALSTAGGMVDESELASCGGVDRVVEVERSSRVPPPRDSAAGGRPVLGFASWSVSAGAPDAAYADGARAKSCERCAVDLRGRHIRQFGFAFEHAGDAAVMRGRWQSHPFDGNPFTRGMVNPHWPAWSWDLAGLYLDGELRDDVAVVADRPALSVNDVTRFPVAAADSPAVLHARAAQDADALSAP